MIPSAQAHDPLGRGNLKVESSKLKVQVHSPGICRDIGDMFLCMLRKDACHTHKMASQLDIMIRYESNLCVNHGLQSSQIVRSPDYDEEGEEDTVLGMCFASRHKLCNIPCSTYYVIEDIYK